MCNANNHQDGCECGFGPPYDNVTIVSSIFADETTNPSLAGQFVISIPLGDMQKPEDSESEAILISSLESALQSIAMKRFSSDGIAPWLTIKIDDLKAGSLLVGFSVVLVGGVSLFKFFKDYKQAREGMLLFLRDVVAGSRHLIKGAKAVIRRVKARMPVRLPPLENEALYVAEQQDASLIMNDSKLIE